MPLTVNRPMPKLSPQANRDGKASMNQSLNHLLNFTLPPRQTHTPRRTTRKPAGYGVRNTERFVNAQYRFVMKPSGDYTVHFADPDIFFQWDDILQVIIPRKSALVTAASHRDDEGLTTCPICLSPPVAPRMTRCGHVFCYPCILHYLSTSEVGKWVRCPICFDSVAEKQLKSVKWFDGPSSYNGAESLTQLGSELDLSSSTSTDVRGSLQMRLMQRFKISTLSLPRSATWPSELMSPQEAPFHFLPDVFTFSKFMLATPPYIITDLTDDLHQIQAERRLLQGMKDDLGIVFVDAAEAKVQADITIAQAMDTETVKSTVEKAHRRLADLQKRETYRQELVSRGPRSFPLEETPEELLIPQSSTAMPHNIQDLSPREANGRLPKQRRNVNPPPPTTSTFYYYQSALGSPVFLHPLDTRILLSHFQSYASFPDEITVEVEAFSEGSVDEEFRKRCRYLALPEGANVVFVETNLESVVGADGLKNFEAALKMRRQKRKDKARKDDRAKFRAEEKEREKLYGNAFDWGSFGGASVPVNVPDATTFAMPSVTTGEPALGTESTPQTVSQTVQTEGAWGSRSFASALHAPPSTRPAPRERERERGHGQDESIDEWDIDLAWHEMQQRGGGGKRKQGRPSKLVILGGGSSGARRR